MSSIPAATIADFCGEIDPIPFISEIGAVRRKSRDQFAVSPLLRTALAGKAADVVVSPRTKDEIIAIIKAAVKYRLPLTARGGGTANYGQSVPLHGGILLDMTAFSGVTAIKPGSIRAKAGTIVGEMDRAAKAQGWEMRIHPSTTEDATIAGFIAGGSGGIGSAQWGMLRDLGNITALELLSVEEEPRTIELRGASIELVHHAYGTNAIITEVEMPLAPAWVWRECLVAFADYMQAVKFGVALAREIGIVKKLISLQEWPIPQWMRDLRGIIPDGQSMANCHIADQSFDAFRDFVAEFGGKIVADHGSGENPFGAPLFEFAYGHGLRHLQKVDLKFTGLQGMFPAANVVETVRAVHDRVAGANPMRLEIFWSQGEVVAMGSPVLSYESEAQMAATVEMMQAEGAHVANSHTTGVREVGIKRITARDFTFKREMDPYGLLNPGKLNFDEEVHVNLPTRGWQFRKTG
jgi:FAD/FMN-containing dehydrogenase